ncbi:MAG: hypothetical protein A2Y12_19725 [Planctomycetes bacterium GWF2_42_9]|nr:MAG: hypothetical protein A2Y12_19725 [Planctomycetes bacterium GWF2_42_9]
MARILYGVAGEGFGHSSRAHLIGQRLIEAGHDVMFAASHKSLEYLEQYFPGCVRDVFGMRFYYRHGQVNAFTTIYNNAANLGQCVRTNSELFKKHVGPFAPELVITDFEPFTAWWAWKHKVPFVSIDNEHLLTHCRLEHRLKDFVPHLNAWSVARAYYFGAAKYFVINFFNVPVKGNRTVVTPPIIRPLVYDLAATNGEHIVLYSTTAAGEAELIETLNKFSPQKFHIYGYNKATEHGNCYFKKRSTEGFLADLASCRGVIASAGFSLISECLHLRKKMLLLPIQGQYEQIINAHYVEKLGLGIEADAITEISTGRFMDLLRRPYPDDGLILWPDNDRFFEILRTHLVNLPIKIKI